MLISVNNIHLLLFWPDWLHLHIILKTGSFRFVRLSCLNAIDTTKSEILKINPGLFR